jgi:hypothetical protein
MVPGNRGHGRQDENPDEHTDVENKDNFTEPLPNEGRDDDNKIREGWKQKREERNKRKKRKDICLTSYNAWWARVEEEGENAIVNSIKKKGKKGRKFEEEQEDRR